MTADIRVGIFGATGYAAIGLLEVLVRHPNVQLDFATTRDRKLSRRNIYETHPNLLGLTNLQLSLYDPENPNAPYNEDVIKKAIESDVVFLCTPEEASFRIVKELYGRTRIIDTSPAFRLKDPQKYKETYGKEHPMPDVAKEFVYGLPELHRNEIRKANYVACPGCNATAMIFAAYPLTKLEGLDGFEITYYIEVGSSEGGREPRTPALHTERSGVVRLYSVTGHRHLAEVEQELGIPPQRIDATMSSVDMIRGLRCIGDVRVDREIDETELRKAFRDAYENEPFIRIRTIPRSDPKFVRGSNYCDVGFEVTKRTSRIILLSALDNLMKGEAGNAVQSMNLMFGLKETIRLEDIIPSYLFG